MKKLFTFIACALVALSASAKLDLSLEDLPNGWGSTYDAATKTISYDAGAWGGRGWNLSAIDNLNDYDYLVVELAKASELKLGLNIEYADELNAEENNGNNTEALLENPGTFVAVQLDKDEKYALQAYVSNKQWQSAEPNNPAGTATLKAAYLCTKAEYEAALENSKNVELKKEIGEAKQLTLEAGKMGWAYDHWIDISVSDYKSLVLELGPVSGKCQLVYKPTTNDADSKYIVIEPSDKNQTIVWTLPEGQAKLTQIAFQNCNKEDGAEDETIKETTVEVKSIYLSSYDKDKITSSISNAVVAPKANVNAPIYNLAGQQVGKSYKGVVIQNGKKFVQK